MESIIGEGSGVDVARVLSEGGDPLAIDPALRAHMDAARRRSEAARKLTERHTSQRVARANYIEAMGELSDLVAAFAAGVPPPDAKDRLIRARTLVEKSGDAFLALSEAMGDELRELRLALAVAASSLA